MNYIEYRFVIEPLEPWREIFLALVMESGFESSMETKNGFCAYIHENDENEISVQERMEVLTEASISFERKQIAQINWNETWEKNFNPITVNDQCYIRADFHESRPEVPYEIVIQPKMSFGTGHHETTYLMVEYLLEKEVEEKAILDMGCGTSVLGILAKKRGAKYVEAVDIDEWAYENSIENARKNNTDIYVKQGDVTVLGEKEFDLILANINKNILIKDIPAYSENLSQKGELILSGILDTDFHDILSVCKENGLDFVSRKQRNDWIAMRLRKNG